MARKISDRRYLPAVLAERSRIYTIMDEECLFVGNLLQFMVVTKPTINSMRGMAR